MQKYFKFLCYVFFIFIINFFRIPVYLNQITYPNNNKAISNFYITFEFDDLITYKILSISN